MREQRMQVNIKPIFLWKRGIVEGIVQHDKMIAIIVVKGF
jgi:hypothetical protein